MPPFGARCHHFSTSPSRNCCARVQHDLRPRQARLDQDQRQHVLQLVAIAGRPAALVRADAAEQPRGIELVGQPGVDEPVEIRPVGADFDLAQPLRPGGARRRQRRVGASSTPTRAACGQRFLRVGAWPKPIAIFASRARRERDFAGEGRDAAPVVARRPVRAPGLDHRPAYGYRAPGRRKSVRGRSPSPALPGSSRRRRSRARNRCADCGRSASRRPSRH